jgi:hypothetical protein
MAKQKKVSPIQIVRKDYPRSIPELERQPLNLSLLALAGIILMLLAIPSFFISFAILAYFHISLIWQLIYGLVNVTFGFMFGFALLYCNIIGKRKPVFAAGMGLMFSLIIIPLCGFGGVIAGCIGLCGSAIGLLRTSWLLPASFKEGPPIIDEIFLMYRDGRLIKHYTRRLKPDIDNDILSSMLVAVQDFIKDSFGRGIGEDGALDEMTFGEFKIVIGRGRWIIIAALVFGQGADRVKPEIFKTVTEIEKKYESILKNWDGVLENMRPLNIDMKDLIDGEYDGKIHYPNA